jgi:hypothetical protein
MAITNHSTDSTAAGRNDEAVQTGIHLLQALIDERRAGVCVPMERSTDEFLAAVDREGAQPT